MFRTAVKDISQDLPLFGEPGSEVSHFILESRIFSKATKLPDNINKPWLKATLKEIKNLINNQTLIFQEPEKGQTVTPCMDVYKGKIWSDGSLDKLKLRIVVIGGLQNKELV